jgi:hypothetical protein
MSVAMAQSSLYESAPPDVETANARDPTVTAAAAADEEDDDDDDDDDEEEEEDGSEVAIPVPDLRPVTNASNNESSNASFPLTFAAVAAEEEEEDEEE